MEHCSTRCDRSTNGVSGITFFDIKEPRAGPNDRMVFDEIILWELIKDKVYYITLKHQKECIDEERIITFTCGPDGGTR
jgi:hypothetical protein